MPLEGISSPPRAPVKVTVPGTTTQPAGWTAARNGSTFDRYTWDVAGSLGSTADAFVQVQACLGSSSTDANPVCSMPSNVTFSQSAFGDDAGGVTSTTAYDIDGRKVTVNDGNHKVLSTDGYTFEFDGLGPVSSITASSVFLAVLATLAKFPPPDSIALAEHVN